MDLAESLEDERVHFFFAGRNDGSNFSKKIIARSKSLSNVTYIGELSFDETNELISKSHIFVNTSRPNEGFPNTFIQSWMRKTPVVSLEFDPDSILENKKLGFCCSNNYNMSERVRYLLNNHNELVSIGENARLFATEKYDINKISRDYAKLFRGGIL